MKLWVDDLRPKPDGFDVWVKTAVDAIVALGSGHVTDVSLDHDLGSENHHETGAFIAKWMEGAAHNGYLKRVKWSVHSANPVGRKNIEMALRKADQYWSEQERE